ncbi:unnamed protein product [Urochloa humidicola]
MVEMDGAVGVGGGGQAPAPAPPRLWRLVDERSDLRAMESDYVRRFHRHEPRDHQCFSAVAKHIKAPVHLLFKPFVSRCEMKGNIEIGSVREVNVKSGLPATRSTERLELLDDNEHILSVRFVGGDHRLQNYSSILTVHPEVIDGRPGTLVIESFVVDVPDGNTKDETCYFVEALLKCNLKSLAEVSENRVTGDQTEPLDR